MPRRSHQTDSFDRLNNALRLAKGTPLSERIDSGSPRSANSRSKAVKARSSRGRLQRFAQEQEARGMVGYRERIAVEPTPELELTLKISTPQIVGRSALGQRRAARPMTWRATPLDQAVTIENRMDRALGRHPDVAIEAPDQEFPDLAGAPVRLLGFEPDNQPLELLRQLVGIAHRPSRSVGQGRQPMLLVPIEYLVAGLPRYPEIPAYVRHRLTAKRRATNRRRSSITELAFHGINTSRQKAKSVTHVSGTKCHLCLRPLNKQTIAGIFGGQSSICRSGTV
jgi:hypothetical protein